MSKEDDYAKVASLKDGETVYVHWFEDGGGQVIRVENELHLFSVPQYGGEELFEKAFPLAAIKELVDEAWSWT